MPYLHTVEFIKYKPNENPSFFLTIKQRVQDYFDNNHLEKTGNRKLYWKTALVFAFYLLPYLAMLIFSFPAWAVILTYAIMFFGKSCIGLNVMHDACHGSFSKYKWVNQLMSYSMNFIGGSSFNWKIQHNLLHHNYTNIYELDEDIEDKPFLKLTPSGKRKKYHRFQHIYGPFLYGFATLSWVFKKDLAQLFKYKRKGLVAKSGQKASGQAAFLIISKLVYLFYIVALPILLGLPWYAVLIGFVVMHLLTGAFISTVFQLAHVVEGPDNHGEAPAKMLDETWAEHQVKTTANFAPKNKLVTWMVGGLNFQIEHHLFPSISHVHYPQIAEIVKKTTAEFNLPYYQFAHTRQAFLSHIRMLKQFGRGTS